jgi:hypothetical protein
MMQGQIADPKAALSFILAGKATVTLRSLVSGNRYTYKIVEAEKRNPNDAPTWFVKLLNGPDNTNSFVYIGIVRNNQFVWTSKSRVGKDAPSVVGFTYVLNALVAGSTRGFEVWHEGRCGRCGRKLTVPGSIATGFGPECAEKIGAPMAGLESPLTPEKIETHVENFAAGTVAPQHSLNFGGSARQPKANGVPAQTKFVRMKAFRDRNDDASTAKFLALSEEAGIPVEDWVWFAEQEDKIDPAAPALVQNVGELDAMIRARVEAYRSEAPENYYQDGDLDEKQAFNVAYNKFRVEIERKADD